VAFLIAAVCGKDPKLLINFASHLAKTGKTTGLGDLQNSPSFWENLISLIE
jgi:hypothetical protein